MAILFYIVYAILREIQNKGVQMADQRKQQLMDLGTEALAEALLDLAARDHTADDLVERMIATPKENIARFKAKLAGLKRSRRFIRWGESAGFARELEILLQDLKAGVDDPVTGAELVVAFYATDSGVFGHCDDSSGHVGEVFRFDAKELFVDYARRCTDKKRLAALVLKLNRKDDYGVRDTLIDCAAEYLPEPDIRMMISTIQAAADKEGDEHRKRHWLYMIEALARQIKDARLFETTRIASWGKLSTADCVDIAQVHLDSGDALTALSWIQRVPENETFQACERDRLMLDILGRLGNTEKQADVAWRIFRRHRSERSLQELLTVIGAECRESVIAGETARILGEKALSLSDAAFLVKLGRTDEAEKYLIDRADKLNGDFYGSLLPLAEAMEAEHRPLVASALYRALLDSILRRGQTKTYPHGVRYLKKLDRLANSITDWGSLSDHATYTQQIRRTHGRKSSFWSRYGS